MNHIENLISFIETDLPAEKSLRSDKFIKSKNNPDFAQILKLLVSEKKKMWQSILNFIEQIERTENKFKQMLEFNEKNQTFVQQFDEDPAKVSEEDDQLNKIFTKDDFKLEDDQFNNSVLLKSFQDYETNNVSLIETNGGASTPIPKAVSKQEKKRKLCGFVQTLQTVDEFAYFK